MKVVQSAMFVLLALAGAVIAGPLQRQHVAADAKWLVHLDLDRLVQTAVGKWLAEAVLDPALARPLRELKQNLGIDFDWRDLSGITAYGTAFKPWGQPNGVLLLDGYDFGAALDQAISRLEQLVGVGVLPLQKTLEDGAAVYSLQDRVFGAMLPGRLFLLSQSKDELTKARQVISGAEPGLPPRKVPAGAEGAFLVGRLDQLQEAPLPPQAQALKAVESAHLSMAQQADNVLLRLSLAVKDADTAAQMQQALQGLLALALLNQPQNTNAQKLAQATRISVTDKTVNVRVELPAAEVIELLKQGQQRRAPNRPARTP